jgi:oligopeptide/dipeptide ABC transporter ATP-binding protein
MYLGLIVETGSSDAVFSWPRHPYTRALLAAVPSLDPRARHRRQPLEGDVPSPVEIPAGCRFRPRCPMAQEICAREAPPLRDLGDGRKSACHFAEQAPPPDFSTSD